MFIDKVHVYVTAGDGGAGCVSFRREKFVPMGGPDGGNGGKGGDVYLEADPHLKTLLDLTYRPHYKALSGSPGGTSNKYGRGAEDLVVRVPPGTVVFKDGHVVADLKTPAQKIMIAKGGRGGRGNSSFKTSRHTAPRMAEKGEPGEKTELDLELRLLADIGLVGFPNAGKSTFLSRISAARPKIADYPFTTLSPNLGVVRMGDQSFVVADIPGLIEGAHAGKGLGDEFLRHIQRTKILIHIVDIFGFDHHTAYRNYQTINAELAKYSKKLSKKPMVIAANKMDLTDADKKLSEFKRKSKNKKIFAISAVSGEGVQGLLAGAFKVLRSVKEEPEITPVAQTKTYRYEPEFVIEKMENAFVVRGAKVEKLAAMTDFNHEEPFARFQNIMKKMGIEKALKEQGILPGDIVSIGAKEFTYGR